MLNLLHGKDRRIIRMIDSGAKALAEIGTERHGIITAGLTELDKTAGLLIASEAGAVQATYTIPPKAGKSLVSGNQLHVVAADEEMLAEMERTVLKGLKRIHDDQGIPLHALDAVMEDGTPSIEISEYHGQVRFTSRMTGEDLSLKGVRNANFNVCEPDGSIRKVHVCSTGSISVSANEASESRNWTGRMTSAAKAIARG